MFDIAITLVNTKERKDIEHSLETLFADSNGSGLSLAVVIVDNASNDGIEELKDKFPNTFIIKQEKNEGFGKSHNKAFALVEAKYYFVLNPDTEFPVGQGFLRKMYDFMETHPKRCFSKNINYGARKKRD